MTPRTQFEISEEAQRALIRLVRWFGHKRAGEIVDAYDWIRENLRSFPDLGTSSDDGLTRVLVRGKLYWVYEVLPNRVRLLNIIDPRQASPGDDAPEE